MWKANNVHRSDKENQHTSPTHQGHIYRARNAENIVRWWIDRTKCKDKNGRGTIQNINSAKEIREQREI